MARAKRAPRSVAPADGGLSSSWTDERLALRANGLAAEQVAQIQRARIVGAMVEVVLELGAANVTVAHVVARAGVSRRTYYDIFTDREDCMLGALDDAIERIAAVVLPAYERKGSARGARAWRERIRAALGELLGLFEADPGLGRFAVVESLAAGPRALALRNRVLESLIAAVDEGRTLKGTSTLAGTAKGHGAGAQAGAGSEPSALTAEGIVGAVASILYARLAQDASPAAADSRTGKQRRESAPADSRTGKQRRESAPADSRKGKQRAPVPIAGGSLIELTGPLMSMIVLPYLGKAAAARELALPVPAARASAQGSGVGYPFHELGMRLTYRTLRVLDAVAQLGGREPGPSNRMVGELAGISDQGQISKLLARLQRLGLIDNAPGVSVKGLSNKWRLTEKGQGIQRAIEEPRGGAQR
jgi:AcrR family transcriptional regulator